MVENKFLIKDKGFIDNLNTLNWICLWGFSGRNMQQALRCTCVNLGGTSGINLQTQVIYTQILIKTIKWKRSEKSIENGKSL